MLHPPGARVCVRVCSHGSQAWRTPVSSHSVAVTPKSDPTPHPRKGRSDMKASIPLDRQLGHFTTGRLRGSRAAGKASFLLRSSSPTALYSLLPPALIFKSHLSSLGPVGRPRPGCPLAALGRSGSSQETCVLILALPPHTLWDQPPSPRPPGNVASTSETPFVKV